MASENLGNKANGSKLSRLLIDKGTQAMRATFDFYCQPAKLSTVLNANKPKLQALRYKVINPSQWSLLYPPGGSPNSSNFDITLLTVLLRNICGLRPPGTGWNTMPPDTDNSISAKILRIKLYRNEVYAHKTNTEVDETKFEHLWQKISGALIDLGIPRHEIDELKDAPLSPEEGGYIQLLIDWKHCEDDLITLVQENHDDTKDRMKKLQRELAALKAMINQQQETNERSKDEGILRRLAKCNFKGNIESLTKKFQTGTREWLFKQVDSWFCNQESDSRVMILTAGPGIGKSVFAAKVCHMYQESKKLAACHFCKFDNSDYKNPCTLLQSLASHMCDNMKGFKENLVEQLQRPHSRETLPDAFRVLLNDPLHALGDREQMMIVVDALDESEVNGKSELLELISEEFVKLPKWIKILITSRPELPVQERLNHLNPFEIRPDDKLNNDDLLFYLKSSLSNKFENDNVFRLLTSQCKGSFLFAYYVQLELRNVGKLLTIYDVMNVVPKGISGFYEKQFKNLKVRLDKLSPSKMEFKRFLDVLVAAKGPLPLGLVRECLGLSKHADYQLRHAVDEIMSSFLPVYNDCLTVYHRSLIDWLTSRGYSEHLFTSDVGNGSRYIWSACERVFMDLISMETFFDIKLTPVMKYAVRYGTSHLIDVGDENKYHWLVNMKLIYVKNNTFPNSSIFFDIVAEWRLVLNRYRSLNSISADLRVKIWQHIRAAPSSDSPASLSTGFYLQSVANGRTTINTGKSDKITAKSVLEKGRYVWCEGLNIMTDYEIPLRVSLFNGYIACVGVSPNMQLAALGHKDGKISILKLSNLEILHTYDCEFTSVVSCCTFSPDNSTLLYGRLDSCLSVKCLARRPFFFGYSDDYLSCSFSPSGKKLVTADNSRFVKLWDVNNQVLLTCLDVEGPVDDCFFSKCGLFIVGKKNTKVPTLAIWNVLTLQRVDRRYLTDDRLLKRYITPTLISWFSSSTLSDKNSEIATVIGTSGPLQFFQLPHGQPLCHFKSTEKYAIINYKHQDCVLIYDQESKSFMTIDPVQQSVVAERRTPLLPGIDGPPVVISKESFVVQAIPYLLSFKIPDQLPFLPLASDASITCCSFSLNASYFATCDDHCIVRIWIVDKCKVIKTYKLSEKGVACWLSEKCLWIVCSTHLAKILINVKQEVNFSEVKIPFQYYRERKAKVLSFSQGVLIMRCLTSNALAVTKIVNDEVQPSKILPTDHSFDCSAVGPGAHSILMVGCTKYQLFKERKNDDQDWYCSVGGNVEFPLHFSTCKCCITGNGEFGIIVAPIGGSFSLTCLLAYIVVNLSVACPCFWSEPLTSVYSIDSYLIIPRMYDASVLILQLQNGQITAMWSQNSMQSYSDMMESHSGVKALSSSIMALSCQHNLIAIPRRDGFINFVKIHIPERNN